MKCGLKDAVLVPSINPKALIQTSENEDETAPVPATKGEKK